MEDPTESPLVQAKRYPDAGGYPETSTKPSTARQIDCSAAHAARESARAGEDERADEVSEPDASVPEAPEAPSRSRRAPS